MKRTFGKFFAALSLAAAGLIFASCGSTSGFSSKYTTDWETVTQDNTQDCGKFFTSPEMGKFSMIQGEFKKDKGSEQSCFGFVFGYTGQKDGILSDYIRFEINTLGEYAVYSWKDGKYTDLINEGVDNNAYMNESSAIVKGLGSVNTLKVEKAKDGTYTCSINGTKVCSAVDPLENGTKGVMAFFSVGTTEQENLPENAVEVSYRITDSSFN